MKKILLIIIFILAPFVSFAGNSNVGIIKGIWFSQSRYFDGDTIRIYTAVQNNSGADVEGEIEFFDNDVSIGKKDFSALDGRIIESWIDKKATSGEHKFSVKITELVKNEAGSQVTPIEAQSIFSEQVVVVKKDTDGDDIADDEDSDDDGDGFSDEEEIEKGTDPLDKNDFPQTEEIQDEENVDGTQDDEETDSQNNAELIEQSPKLIQELAEKNEVIAQLTIQISKLQKSGKDFFQNETKRIDEIKKKKEIVKNKQNDKQDIAISPQNLLERELDKKEKTQSTWKEKLHSVYSVLLKLFSWLFSLWWFVVLLLFFGIYIVLKLIFRVFGRRDD
jgi:hypothetical protein